MHSCSAGNTVHWTAGLACKGGQGFFQKIWQEGTKQNIRKVWGAIQKRAPARNLRGVGGMPPPPPKKFLACRSSEIDSDAIWGNLGGKNCGPIFNSLFCS